MESCLASTCGKLHIRHKLVTATWWFAKIYQKTATEKYQVSFKYFENIINIIPVLNRRRNHSTEQKLIELNTVTLTAINFVTKECFLDIIEKVTMQYH